MSVTSTKETRGFQAEVKQLLHLMIHSLYGNKEIFLRELVSNASDACDKLRFESVAHGALDEEDPEFRIRVSYDRLARTLTVSDNGVGLSRQEVIDQIGTIAKSGTREFFERLTAEAAKDAQLIGQFGVGFYSCFIVAERVVLLSRRAGVPADEGVRWESAGEGDYTVEVVRKETRGTDVTLYLRPAEDELLSGSRLREILRKYSDHITFPILMKKERWDPAKKAQVVTDEDEQVNQASALWAQPKSEVTEAEYHEFYTHVAHDFDPPLAWTHAKVEGRQEFIQLFYIPRRAPFDLWDRDQRHGVKLYVRRVFIMDAAEQLLPGLHRGEGGGRAATFHSTCRAKSCSSPPTWRGSARHRSSGCWACSRIWPSITKRSTARSGPSLAVCSRKASSRTPPTGSASRSCFASRRLAPIAPIKQYRWPTTWDAPSPDRMLSTT